MIDRVHDHPDLIFSVGTQVVTLIDLPGAGGLIMHPRGTVGVVVKALLPMLIAGELRLPDAERIVGRAI